MEIDDKNFADFVSSVVEKPRLRNQRSRNRKGPGAATRPRPLLQDHYVNLSTFYYNCAVKARPTSLAGESRRHVVGSH